MKSTIIEHAPCTLSIFSDLTKIVSLKGMIGIRYSKDKRIKDARFIATRFACDEEGQEQYDRYSELKLPPYPEDMKMAVMECHKEGRYMYRSCGGDDKYYIELDIQDEDVKAHIIAAMIVEKMRNL